MDFIAVSADMEVDYVSTNEALQPDARQEEDEGPHCEEKVAWHLKPQLRSRQRPRQAKTFILSIRHASVIFPDRHPQTNPNNLTSAMLGRDTEPKKVDFIMHIADNSTKSTYLSKMDIRLESWEICSNSKCFVELCIMIDVHWYQKQIYLLHKMYL